MITQTQRDDQIRAIAMKLSAQFIKPLLSLSHKNSYFIHIAGLAEILDWATEFYEQHKGKLNSEERFNLQSAPPYVTGDDLIVAFGSEKIMKFHSETADADKYFLEKYRAIMKESDHENFH